MASTSLADGPNWPQWRGPNGSGKTSTDGALTQWGRDQNVNWRIDLPEPGNSTPVVWGDRIFLTQPLSESNERGLICVDRKTGQERWRSGVVYTEEESTHKTNPYCSASPVTDGQRVIAWFGSAGLVCWDFDGNELWRRDLGRQEHMWGYGSSPIMHDDLCILNFGPGNREFLIAVDKKTGETRWKVDSMDDKAERELSGPENDGSANEFGSTKQRSERLRGSWNTPIIVQVDDHSELVAALPRRVSAFDPSTGELLWTCGGGGTWSTITHTADGLMYLLAKSGTTTVFRPDREKLRRIAENELKESTNASVVVAGGDVLIRTDEALWCFAAQ